MERLQVNIPGTTAYDVMIADGLRRELNEYIADSYSSILIIADRHVADLYMDDITNVLKTRGNIFCKVIPPGEGTKSMEWYDRLLDYCISCNLDRKSLIIALGGGMTGDLAGFVAATYLRGISYIQMPTSILAHDSSVGGKVAINHKAGKNLIGAFHHPDKVLFDTEMIDSLPLKEKRSGYGEVVKHALLSDKCWFDEIMERELKELENHKAARDLIRGVRLKASIVEQDEKEAGVRKYLNLGHTLAHAIETELDYGSVTHGEAVVIGIIFALSLSGMEEERNRLLVWADNNGYPLEVVGELDERKLLEHMKRDKKAERGKINYVLLQAVGSPYVSHVEEDELLHALKQFKNEVIE